MKRFKSYILIISVSLLMGCGNYENNIPSNDEQISSIKESVDENNQLESNKEIQDMYEYLKIDKANLEYNILNPGDYFYEAEMGLVGMRLLDQLPKVNDKKYGDILQAYTFASEYTRVSMRYEKALEYVQKVLPDDIKVEREKFNPETGKIYIFYTSSRGNFVADLNCENYIYKDGKQIYDKSTISGISYMKEIIE